MSGSVKFSELIRQYDGTGDFLEWIQKLELVAKLQKVEGLQQFLPLFLSGGAFAVYQGLSEEDKDDYKAVRRHLISAFSVGPFKAYEDFVARRCAVGEAVDVYLADLTRLALLVSPERNEQWLLSAFVCGLPDDVKAQMQAACSLKTMALPEVVEKARSLVTTKESCFASVNGSGGVGGGGFRGNASVGQRRPGAGGSPGGRDGRISCFSCGGTGHIQRDCPSRKNSAAGRFCYVCGGPGHMAQSCPQRKTEPAKND